MGSGKSGPDGDRLGHPSASQTGKGMCQRPRELRRAAGLTQLQEEVMVVYPESGGDGPVGGGGRQVPVKSEGHRDECSLQYRRDNCKHGTIYSAPYSEIFNIISVTY